METYGSVAWAAHLVRRNLEWAGTQGVRQLFEEHELSPVTRAATAARNANWRRRHGVRPGEAVAVFLSGVPRSGTNMMARALMRSPEIEVHNEGRRSAFHRYRLRPDRVIRGLVLGSRHRFVVFKPLLDAYRLPELLDRMDWPKPAKAVWVYRDVDGRVRSALKKFGPAGSAALRDIAAGTGADRWQAQGLSATSLALIRSIDWQTATPADGAALIWYVRNRCFLDQGLHRRPDVLLVSYDAVAAAPEPRMRDMCAFLGVTWQPRIATGIDRRAMVERTPVRLDPRIRAACDELASTLAATRLS